MRRRVPDGEPASRDLANGPDEVALAELLRSVRDVRTTLAIDLSAAAGALEDGRPEVARDILSATSREVTSTAARAHERRARPVTPRPRHRRLLLALPLIPLVGGIAMTTAAAMGWSGVNGALHEHHPTSVMASSAPHAVVAVHLPSSTTAHDAATTTLHRLEHVVKHDPRAAQVLAVAADLHKQLTAMIATSTNDPARLHVVQQLLTLEQHVLEASKVPGTQLALEASREIARLLERTPPRLDATPSPATHPKMTSTSTPKPVAATPHSSRPARHTSSSTPKSATGGHTATSTRSNPLFGPGVFLRR